MDPERLIGEVISSFLGGRSRRRRGLGGLVTPARLLTVGGLVWGALESMQQSTVATGTAHVPHAGARGAVPTPPPVPPRTASAPASPPPIPGTSPAVPPVPATDVARDPGVTPLLPLVQLAVSAARADGEMSDSEIATIREHAARVGAQALVDAELAVRRPVESITPAFTTDAQRRAAYAVAFAVVHGTDEVSPGERMYLTQLARLLRLPPDDAAAIEAEQA